MDGVTVRTNPLVLLGVPKALLVREQSRPAVILNLVEGFYKTLAKQYHPDAQGGDAELMASLSEAFEELRDPAGLEYYLEELLESGVESDVRNTESVSRMEERRKRAFTAISSVLSSVNQYEVLGIDRPTSFYFMADATPVIIDVTSCTDAVISVSGTPDDIVLSSDNLINAPKMKYRSGLWHDSYLVGDRARKFVHDDLTRVANARIVGSYAYGYSDEFRLLQRDSFSEYSLSAGASKFQLNWTEPEHAWYLGGLTPRLVKGDVGIACNQYGRVVNLGLLVASAAM